MQKITKNELINFLQNEFEEYKSLSNDNPYNEATVDPIINAIEDTKYNTMNGLKEALKITLPRRKNLALIVPPATRLIDLAYALALLDEKFRKSIFPGLEGVFEEK